LTTSPHRFLDPSLGRRNLRLCRANSQYPEPSAQRRCHAAGFGLPRYRSESRQPWCLAVSFFLCCLLGLSMLLIFLFLAHIATSPGIQAKVCWPNKHFPDAQLQNVRQYLLLSSCRLRSSIPRTQGRDARILRRYAT